MKPPADGRGTTKVTKITKAGHAPPDSPRRGAASGRGPEAAGESVGVEPDRDRYYYEIAEFIDLIEQGRPESAVNSHANSLATLEIIDEVRRQLGVVYPADGAR